MYCPFWYAVSEKKIQLRTQDRVMWLMFQVEQVSRIDPATKLAFLANLENIYCA